LNHLLQLNTNNCQFSTLDFKIHPFILNASQTDLGDAIELVEFFAQIACDIPYFSQINPFTGNRNSCNRCISIAGINVGAISSIGVANKSSTRSGDIPEKLAETMAVRMVIAGFSRSGS
jgi:hypothetical protein